jgi:hypothetical protein
LDPHELTMRAGGLVSLLLLALLALSVLHAAHVSAEEVAVADDGELLIEEELEAAGEPAEEETPKMDPRLTVEAFDHIISKMTAKCRTEIQANPSDPSQVSERCRAEIGHKIQRYLTRLDREEQKLQNGEEDEPQQKTKKPRKKKTKMSKKQARAAREAAEARKKEEEHQQTLQVIIGFVATVVAVIVGATWFINRKLKAAGMYYPADPDAKAGCCN